ncbi:hypothetical protein DL769_011518 [Monosporascus sp. CRB-8-3]|nr:hypothetical protein DL769_011518 [Monosporascus sp. CRB-8-3]
MSLAMTPPGLGTGHSRSCLGLGLASFCSPSKSSSRPSNAAIPSLTSAALLLDRLRLVVVVPSGFVTVTVSVSVGGEEDESAYATRGAGHGSTCGSATTKKDASTVVAKSEDVIRDRGCRCGGIFSPCLGSVQDFSGDIDISWHAR